MALLAWLWVSAVMSLLVPGTAAQSRCMVTVRIPNTQPGAGVSQATINMALVNSGTTAIPAGDQSFTMQNPTYVKAVSTSGWTAQGTSNGVVTGVVQLAQPLAPSASTTLGAVIEGTSPQNFFPRSITLGGTTCQIQQMRKLK